MHLCVHYRDASPTGHVYRHILRICHMLLHSPHLEGTMRQSRSECILTAWWQRIYTSIRVSIIVRHTLFTTVLYLSWLTCGSRLTFPHIHVCVMGQFSYMRYIPIDPYVSATPIMTHRDMDDIFYDYLNHLVLEKAQSTIIESNWSYINGSSGSHIFI